MSSVFWCVNVFFLAFMLLSMSTAKHASHIGLSCEGFYSIKDRIRSLPFQYMISISVFKAFRATCCIALVPLWRFDLQFEQETAVICREVLCLEVWLITTLDKRPRCIVDFPRSVTELVWLFLYGTISIRLQNWMKTTSVRTPTRMATLSCAFITDTRDRPILSKIRKLKQRGELHV